MPNTTIQKVLNELIAADQKYPPMAEAVEGLHTIKCELAELEREIMRRSFDQKALNKEAIQVAAMSLKFLRDCCGMDIPAALISICPVCQDSLVHNNPGDGTIDTYCENCGWPDEGRI